MFSPFKFLLPVYWMRLTYLIIWKLSYKQLVKHLLCTTNNFLDPYCDSLLETFLTHPLTPSPSLLKINSSTADLKIVYTMFPGNTKILVAAEVGCVPCLCGMKMKIMVPFPLSDNFVYSSILMLNYCNYGGWW